MNMRFFLRTFYKVCVVIVFTTSLLGCQLTDFTNSEIKDTNNTFQNDASFAEYYLSVKQLNPQELLAEIETQKGKAEQEKSEQNKAGSHSGAEYRLLLLHSLLNSSTPNAHIPDALLQDMALSKTKLIAEEQTQLPTSDLALVLMAQDKIKQDLLVKDYLLHKQKTNAEVKKQLKTQQEYINELELGSQKLQQQIIQLKEIERSINDHGTPL